MDAEESLGWITLPEAPSDVEQPVTASATKDRVVVAYAPQEGEQRGMELLVLIDGSWVSAGVLGVLPAELTVSGRRMAWLAPGRHGLRVQVQAF